MLHTDFDSAFFEKSRLAILTLVYSEGEVSFNELKSTLEQSDGALYSHIKKLIEKSYLSSEKIIRHGSAATVYRMTRQGTDEFKRYLIFLEELLKRTG